ncbi:hypothetical protein Tco_0781430 [Tanacetum coccineum]
MVKPKNITDSSGWTWIFHNNKKTVEKQIDYPFHKELSVGIKSFLMLFGITAALIDVNAAQSKLVLLVNFNENYSKCLRLLEEVTTARGSYYC